MVRSPWHEEFDLIVVGASVGGLTAAVVAADRGCRTLVVERGKELGGDAAVESELLAAAGSRLQAAARVADAPRRLIDDVLAASQHHVDAAVLDALAGEGAPLVAWLADRCGCRVTLLPSPGNSGHSVARLHALGERGGASLVADLSRAASRHARITIRTGTAVEHLVRDDTGAVRAVAVRGERRGVTQQLAGRVLLACGGFVGNDELVGQHAAALAGFPARGSGRATGEGLRLGLAVGARTTHLGACQVTPFLAMPGEIAVGTPLVALGGVLVNQAGRRFFDETADAIPLARAVRAQPGRVAYLVFDDRIADAARAMDPFFAHVVLPRAGRHAASVADLAKQFELNADALALTLDTFNANLDLGGDPFGRERSGPPLAPPLHAIRVTGARLRSLGGLAVDRAARVLGDDGRPVVNLYAAGGAAAGLVGEDAEHVLDGTDTLVALGLGRLAAIDVANAASTRDNESSAS